MIEKPQLKDLLQTSLRSDQAKSVVDEYHSFHDSTVETRKADYTKMVNDYYDLVTDFYEYGWGQSFHFAPRHTGETFEASLARHEFYLAHALGLKPGMQVLDVGCGVGGPMRAIARFSGATIVGVNNNDYQIKRGTQQNQQSGLSGQCSFMKADFMRLPVPDASYDAVYAIEATCHAPDKLKLFTELHRVMKPGAEFAAYEWCLTDRYDGRNAEHRAIKKGIEEGTALPDIWTTHEVIAALEKARFEVLQARDLAPTADAETPWQHVLSETFSLSNFKRSTVGREVTRYLVRVLERLRIAPEGSTAVAEFLNAGAKALVQGGDTGIFTPMFFFDVRKPTARRA
jgi:sterol 24-C-methyltransferase